MYQFTDNSVLWKNKLVMEKVNNEWSLSNVDMSLPLDVAVNAFKFWYKYRLYVNRCSAETIATELGRDDQHAYMLNKYFDSQGNEHPLPDKMRNQRVDLSLGAFYWASKVTPLVENCMIEKITTRYDPSIRAMRVYYKWGLVAVIPLYF